MQDFEYTDYGMKINLQTTVVSSQVFTFLDNMSYESGICENLNRYAIINCFSLVPVPLQNQTVTVYRKQTISKIPD